MSQVNQIFLIPSYIILEAKEKYGTRMYVSEFLISVPRFIQQTLRVHKYSALGEFLLMIVSGLI